MKMTTFIAGTCLCLLAAAAPAADTNSLSIVPWPQNLTLRDGTFKLSPDTRVYVDAVSRETGKFLMDQLRESTGYPVKPHLVIVAGTAIKDGILLTTRFADTNLGPEGYELTVTANSVVIRAPTQAGLFYGVQTLLELFPPQIFSKTLVQNMDWQAPCVHIMDWPRFTWRGLHLDVSRHFFTKSEVETILDAMAMMKLNRFHWHLTDDQGWRIEIKKYPKLTEVGAWRGDVGFGLDPKSTTAYGPDGRYGGYYTQNDIREVVKYAAARHITVVPEIEMPGHSLAALASYPQFACVPGPFVVTNNSGVFPGIYDPAKEETFKFLDDVLTEVFQMFPGKYVHLGGDEVRKATWRNSPDCQALMKKEGLKNEEALQGWFMQRMENFVAEHNRIPIGWSEILQGGIASNAVVMDWIGGAKEAATQGHDVIMTPTSYCYLDFYQSDDRTNEPKAAAWGPTLTLEKMYQFEPMPSNVPADLQFHILGAQANLWTEWVPNLKHAEYMIFPRECALAEDTWSPKSSRDFDDFSRRMQTECQRFDVLGINYRHITPNSSTTTTAQ